MTGGHVQGDLLAPEDVVSLLLDDAQLEQKLREIPTQVGKIWFYLNFPFPSIAVFYYCTTTHLAPFSTCEFLVLMGK